jgi:hypothetical protein
MPQYGRNTACGTRNIRNMDSPAVLILSGDRKALVRLPVARKQSPGIPRFPRGIFSCRLDPVMGSLCRGAELCAPGIRKI